MLPIQIAIDDVTVTRQIANLEVTVADEYRHLVYVGKPQPHQVPISYIGMPQTSPKNIEIKDLNEIADELTVTENSYLVRYLRRTQNKVFDLTSRFALITDVTVNDNPLFFKHTITDGITTTPEIVDQDMVSVLGSHFKLLVSNSEILMAHDLEPEIDIGNNKLRAYYIRYVNTAGEQIFKLLETEPLFSKADLLDWPGGDKRVYTVRKVGPNYRYRILYNGSGPFFLKLNRESQIKLLKPTTARPNEPWYLRVTDGELSAFIDNTWEHFFIPEYHFQTFSPVEPYQYSGVQECQLLTQHVALAPFQHIVDNDDYHIEVLITSDTLVPKYGFTSGSTSPRTYWVDRMGRFHPQSTMIRFPLESLSEQGLSLNRQEGLIHIPTTLDSTDRVFIKCYRELKEFVYRSLNINPIHNTNLRAGRALLYAIPESEMAEFQIGIQHLILDIDNNIIGWSDTRLEDEDGELIADLVPIDDTESGLELFKDEYPNYLILGIVSINREASINDLTFIDVREPGGKLADRIENNLRQFLDTHPELQWLSDDSISGRTIPLHGAFVTKVPFEVLDEAGGELTRDDVKEIIQRHISLGAYPIIKYYADVPEILDMSYDTETGELTVVWLEVSDKDSYRIYIGTDGSGFISTDAEGTAHAFLTGALETTLQLGGFSSTPDINILANQTIYVYIAPLKDSYEWPPSQWAKMDILDISGSVLANMAAVISSPPTVSFSLAAEIEEE